MTAVGWLMGSCPFRDQEPIAVMVEKLAAIAAELGRPLSKEDRAFLVQDWRPDRDAPAWDDKFKPLVVELVERERIAHENGEDISRGFIAAIEWVGDQDYPYLVHLAVGTICREGLPVPALSLRKRINDKIALLITALVFIVFLAAISMAIVWMLGE